MHLREMYLYEVKGGPVRAQAQVALKGLSSRGFKTCRGIMANVERVGVRSTLANTILQVQGERKTRQTLRQHVQHQMVAHHLLLPKTFGRNPRDITCECERS